MMIRCLLVWCAFAISACATGGSQMNNEQIRKIGNDVCAPYQLVEVNQDSNGVWHIYCQTDSGVKEVMP